jgi:hypothetical protein
VYMKDTLCVHIERLVHITTLHPESKIQHSFAVQIRVYVGILACAY